MVLVVAHKTEFGQADGELLVSLHLSDRSLAEAPELVGFYHELLAIPAPVSALSGDAAQQEALGQLTSYAEPLAQLIVGLRHYGRSEFEVARTEWAGAVGAPVWESSESGWLIHLLLGNAYLKLDSD